ncbi:MAG: alpha/beta hydrolase [Sulfurospirillum sp.]
MKTVLFMALFIYLAVVAYVYFTQDSKIFNYAQIEKSPPIELKGSEKVSLEVAKGVVLHGVYEKSKQNDAPLIIYFGGNSDDATRFLLYVEGLKDFNILAFNYRGYMDSGGKPSEKNLFKDAIKIYDKFAKNLKVILIGRSLGTGVASYLASKREVKGLVLITPYDSIASLAKEKYPYLPIDLLLKYKFESTKYISKIKTPVAIIEVKDDITVPNTNTAKLIKKIKNLVLFAELTNTTHAEVFHHPDFEKTLKEAILKF